MNGGHIEILLIEDNIGDSRLIREYLREELPLAKLTIAEKLSVAQLALSTGVDRFDIILLDLALPDSFGLKTLDAITKSSPKNTPIIVLTGNDDKADAVKAMRLGAQDYITKGRYTAESLARAINYAVERKNTETTILEQQQALLLASKLTVMGELTAFVMHEILNPLGVISMSAELLSSREGSGDGTFQEKYASTISRNVKRILKITDGLKSFVNGSNHAPLEKVQLSQILSGVVELCEVRFVSNGIPFEIVKPNLPVELHCREVQIAQVLVNLLNNAFDAVKDLPKKWVKLKISDHGDVVEFSVQDSGPGIPDDLVHKILETFFTTKRTSGGTGLGLSISKRIVDEHGGNLEIDQSSSNTHFVVRLPKNPSMNATQDFQNPAATEIRSLNYGNSPL
ncbi:MAG: sensor histidine kinase [Pseudobdellovibrionaceae bacterium]